MTTQEIIDAYSAQGTDILNDHEFRAEAIGTSEFSLEMLRSGDMEGAKTKLQRYLEVDPEGPDAATARETIKYL